jgi:hypothetical protein
MSGSFQSVCPQCLCGVPAGNAEVRVCPHCFAEFAEPDGVRTAERLRANVSGRRQRQECRQLTAVPFAGYWAAAYGLRSHARLPERQGRARGKQAEKPM